VGPTADDRTLARLIGRGPADPVRISNPKDATLQGFECRAVRMTCSDGISDFANQRRELCGPARALRSFRDGVHRPERNSTVALPILTTAADVDEIVGYLKNKATGASLKTQRPFSRSRFSIRGS
jgi:hypothetical protein